MSRALSLTVASLLLLPSISFGELINVNSTKDLPDADLMDGVCDADLVTAGLQCTLRAAIMHANATMGADEIVLPAGVFKLTIKGTLEDQCLTGDLDVTDDLLLRGAGAGLTVIDGKKAKDRILEIPFFSSLTVRDLTLRKGKSPKGESGGGGIRNDAGTLLVEDCVIEKCSAKDDAGAVDTQSGDTTLRRVLLSRNKASDDGGAVDLDGGTLAIEDSTLVKNKAKNEGGAVENSAGDMTLVNVTLSGNHAKEGGALSLEDGANTTITNCTLTGNHAKVGAGLSTRDDQFGFNTTTVTNTIFDDSKKKNQKASVGSALTSLGGNLDLGVSCGFGVGDLSNAKAKLGKLKDNGGPTPTHALGANSPAIDAGNDGTCPTNDQRGLPRVDIPLVGTATCDIGAYEAQG